MIESKLEKIADKTKSFDLRDYMPYIVAGTLVTGTLIGVAGGYFIPDAENNIDRIGNAIIGGLACGPLSTLFGAFYYNCR